MSEWSPYALESYRSGTSKRRVRWLSLALILLAVLWAAVMYASQGSDVRVGLGGGDTSSILVDKPEEKSKPVTIKVQPGQVLMLDSPVNQQSAPRAAGGRLSFEQPYPIYGYLLIFGPILLLPYILRRLMRRPARTELNYGIYKGAMPLEMISATHRDLVFAAKPTKAPLFGKSRRDYLSAEE